MSTKKIIRETKSVCPICLKKIKATLVAYDNDIYLEKTCPDHGNYATKVWTAKPSIEEWLAHRDLSMSDHNCPEACGICDGHQQDTCCVLLEVTNQCNLKCPVCFASAGEDHILEPSIEEITSWYQMLLDQGGPYNIQLSGGEPTLRDDLPEIITLGKSMGFDFFQLNTNGIRLSEDDAYLKRLAKAGLNCVFLQFDGLNDTIYNIIRGKSLLEIKRKTIEKCKLNEIGVVLVPTLIRNVNHQEIGDIIRFAIDQMPAIRGVHFQPMSHFGRYPEQLRAEYLTLSEVMTMIEAQSKGAISLTNFVPPASEHPMCSFNASFRKDSKGTLKPLTTFGKNQASCCQTSQNAASKAREFVARQWSAPKTCTPVFQMADHHTTENQKAEKHMDLSSLDLFLEEAKYTLTISGMAFQDAWTLDLTRLQHCHIHVVSPEGTLIPFCAYNLTAKDGRALYRK